MGQAAIVLSLFQGIQERKKGIKEQAADRRRVQRERLAARDAQIERNEELLNELATRRALQGAGGGGPGGSFEARQERSFRIADLDFASLEASVAGSRSELSKRGKSAVNRGNISAVSTLAQGVNQASLLK